LISSSKNILFCIFRIWCNWSILSTTYIIAQ
jgi:hypothetical protein